MSQALLVALDDELAVLAREQLVVQVLEPVAAFEPGTLAADPADQRGRERVGGIAARRLGHESDAGQLELLHRGNDLVAHSTREVREVEAAVGQAARADRFRLTCRIGASFGRVDDRRR